MHGSNSSRAGAFVIAAGASWGLIGLFSRSLSQAGLDAVQITASRCILTAIVMLGFVFFNDKKQLKISLSDLWMFVGTGVCSILFFNICYFVTIRLSTLSAASVLLYTAPCFVMLLSALVFRERVTLQKLAALLLAFGGCALTTGVFSERLTIAPLALLTGLGSGFFYALYSIFGTLALRKYSAVTVTTYTFVVAALSIVWFSRPLQIFSALGSISVAGNMLLLSLLSTVAAFLFYTKGLEQMEAAKASVMAFVEPMVATVVGITVFREPVGIANTVGITLIFASVVLLNWKFQTKLK